MSIQIGNSCRFDQRQRRVDEPSKTVRTVYGDSDATARAEPSDCDAMARAEPSDGDAMAIERWRAHSWSF